MAGVSDDAKLERIPAPGSGDPETAEKGRSFQDRVREFERQVIADALAETGGRVTKAAKNLGLTHQGLCYIINHRHKDLLSVRTPIRIRRKSIITKGKTRRRDK